MASVGMSDKLFIAAMEGLGFTDTIKSKLLAVFLDSYPPIAPVEKFEDEMRFVGLRFEPARRHVSLEEKRDRASSVFGKRAPHRPMSTLHPVHTKAAKGFDRKVFNEMVEELAKIETSEDITAFFKKIIERAFPAVKLTSEDSRYVSKALLESISRVDGASFRARQNSKMIKDPLIRELVVRTISMSPCR